MVINSFDKQINQTSTPLHHKPNNSIFKGNHTNSYISLKRKFFIQKNRYLMNLIVILNSKHKS